MFEGMRYVYEVYRQKSFSKAAKQLFISQPSLSAAVKKEEEHIGFPIFDRSTNPVRLTELGWEYIRSAELIMDVQAGFADYIHDLSELKSGSLTIGGTNLFISYILPPLLSRFTELYPRIRVGLVEAATPILTERLSLGQMDLLLDNIALAPAIYDKRTLCQEYLLLAVPRSFPSNARAERSALTAGDIRAGRHTDPRVAPVSLQLFENDPFLLLQEGNDTRDRAQNLFRSSGFSPRIRLELAQQITAYNLACHGMGICFTGDCLIRNVPENQDLLFYKVNGREAIREVNFYYRRSRFLTQATITFLDMATGRSPDGRAEPD